MSVCRSVCCVDCHIVAGSLRMATIGDSRVARHAGKNDATVVTAATIAVDATNGSGPRSPISKTRTSAHDDRTTATPPIAAPYAAMVSPLLTTITSRSRPEAPSAIRVPISTVAWRTEYETTP